MKSEYNMIAITIIFAIPFLVQIGLLAILPDVVPTHFDSNGVADQWNNKYGIECIFSLFLFPILGIICGSFFVYKIAKSGIHPIGSDWKYIGCTAAVVVLLFTGYIDYIMLSGVILDPIEISHIQFIIGIIITILGLIIKKIKVNIILGIRINTTLNDKEKWNKTNSVASITMTLCGIFVIMCSFYNTLATIPIIILAVIISAIVPVIYIKRGGIE